jgi:hypothetical protein
MKIMPADDHAQRCVHARGWPTPGPVYLFGDAAVRVSLIGAFNG